MKLSIVLLLSALESTAPVAEQTEPDLNRLQLRVRAVLALVLTEPVPAEYRYRTLYQRAIREQKPLLVWVGQPSRDLPGCLTSRVKTFPGILPPAVVVGIPSQPGILQRIDLPGFPSDAEILARLPGGPGLAVPRGTYPSTETGAAIFPGRR